MHLHVYEWELSALHMLTLVCTGPETDELGRLHISIPFEGTPGASSVPLKACQSLSRQRTGLV